MKVDLANTPIQPPHDARSPWASAVKPAVIWILIGGGLAGLLALLDEFSLRQPFDNVAEALVVIVPLSVPFVAGAWHRSWRVASLLGATLVVFGVCFLAFSVFQMMFFGGGWAR